MSTTLAIISLIISGGLNAFHDLLYQEKIYKHSDYWNPGRSWVRKYKNNQYGRGEKFIGSTTILVWLTDGIHLVKLIMYILLILGAYTTSAFISIPVFFVSFELFYRLIQYINNFYKLI